MTKMTATGTTKDFCPHHPVAAIETFDDSASFCVEAWPAATGIKFLVLAEKDGAATCAMKEPVFVNIQKCTCKGTFCGCLSEHSKLLWTQLLPPLVFGLLDCEFTHHVAPPALLLTLPVSDLNSGSGTFLQ